MNTQSLIIALVSALGVTQAVSAETADTAQYVTRLRDVEVVGLKQMPDKSIDLTTNLSRQMLERYNIQSVREASALAPNVFIPQYGSRMTSSIYVRGLGTRIDNPVVGLNVDNVPYLNKDNYDFDLVDMERLEFVRGAAGVLNGRNAMAGQINVYTMSPWAYKGLRAMLQYGRGNSFKGSVGYYWRMGSKVASSVTLGSARSDGFFRNKYDNDRSGSEKAGNARWKLSWHPDSRWSLSNTASVNLNSQHGYPYESMATGIIAYNDSMDYRRTSFADGLTVSYTGKRMIATSVTSVQYLDDDMRLDQDFLPVDYFTLRQKRHEWALTQDIFAKGVRGKYTWLIGVFGFVKNTHMDAPVTFRQDGIDKFILSNINKRLPQGMELRWDDATLTLGSLFDTRDRGVAVYHQSTYKAGPVTLQAGLRLDAEFVSMDYTGRYKTACSMWRQMGPKWVSLMTVPMEADLNGTLSQSYVDVLPQLAAEWEAAQWLKVRGSVAKGYKAGGYNTQMFSNVLENNMKAQMMGAMPGGGGGRPQAAAAADSKELDVADYLSYKPEKSWTYELTLSGRTNDGRLQGAVTGFLLRCRDQQLTYFPEGATGRAMTNAGRTRSMGVETTMRYDVTENLNLRASYGYTNATFRQYNDGKTDFRGRHLPYAPSHTVFAGVSYKCPFSISEVTPVFNTDVTGAGRIWWDDDNTLSQPFYATLGASVDLQHDWFTLSLWGRNITNTRYSTFYFESVGNRFTQRAQPWTVGATLRVQL